MHVLPRVGMSARHIFIQLDAQAGLARRDHIALFPANRLLQDLGMESAPGLDALQDQEVRDAGGDLDIRSAFDRPRSEERRVGKECRSRWWRSNVKKKGV